MPLDGLSKYQKSYEAHSDFLLFTSADTGRVVAVSRWHTQIRQDSLSDETIAAMSGDRGTVRVARPDVGTSATPLPCGRFVTWKQDAKAFHVRVP